MILLSRRNGRDWERGRWEWRIRARRAEVFGGGKEIERGSEVAGMAKWSFGCGFPSVLPTNQWGRFEGGQETDGCLDIRVLTEGF